MTQLLRVVSDILCEGLREISPSPDLTGHFIDHAEQRRQDHWFPDPSAYDVLICREQALCSLFATSASSTVLLAQIWLTLHKASHTDPSLHEAYRLNAIADCLITALSLDQEIPGSSITTPEQREQLAQILSQLLATLPI